MIYSNPKIGQWCEAAGHPGHVWAIEGNEDGDGNPMPDKYEVRGWGEAWAKLPSEEELSNWSPPPAEPDPQVVVAESTRSFASAEEKASTFLNALKGRVVVYLKTKFDDASSVAAGVAFVDPDIGIGKEYDYFIKAGGHPLAAAKLYAKIQSVKNTFAWFDDTVNEIFTAALTRA